MKRHSTIMFAALILAGLLGAQSTVTLPAGFDAVDGNALTSFPQDTTADQRWQWHYDSAQFTGITGPILITGIQVRAFSPGAAVAAFNFPTWNVTLIEASTDYLSGAHDPTFANNVLTSSVVRTGPWTGGPVSSTGQTTADWIDMGITGSFLYDPTTGNDFIIQISKCGGGTGWGVPMDGASGPHGTVGGNRYGHVSSCGASVSNFNNDEFVPIVRLLYTQVSPLTDDLSLESIDAPQSSGNPCDALSTTETVSVTFRNLGSNLVPSGTTIPIQLDVDTGAQTAMESVVLASDLNPLDTVSFTFATSVDLSAPGPHIVEVTLAWAPDGNVANDQQTQTVTSGGGNTITTFPWVEDFDGFGAIEGSSIPPANWEQEVTDGSGPEADWTFRSNVTPTPGTGPTGDFDAPGSGFYAYVEDEGNFASVGLLSPCLDLTGLAQPTLVFRLWSESAFGPGFQENVFSVDVLTYPGGVATPQVFGPVGHLGSGWRFQVVDLTAFAGQVIRLRFAASSDGGGTGHDIALDHVRLFDRIPGPGQAPQPGLATLDISASETVDGFPVSSGENGPYFTSASTGDTMTFVFGGEPNQSILLLAGPLQPGLTGFQNVGQFDIGTGVDPMTLFPTGVVLVADGTLSTPPHAFFRTTSNGTAVFSAPLPPLPPGPWTTFQAALFTSLPSVLSLTNAVQINVSP
ncbi:MAG TPA: hypothetical protein ENK43_08925 [Planctomycetes bacterium]|nr:hypothetical protein [Planctomycetota bacterium]